MNIMLRTILFLLILIASGSLASQNIGINEDGSNPDPSAILDIKAIDKGFLVPRLSSLQKDNILTPAEGLMVYQTDGTKGFYYYDGSYWTLLLSQHGPYIRDEDEDTQIHVESNSDEDKVRFTLGGTESLMLSRNAFMIPMLEVVNSSENTLFGENAGLNLNPISLSGVQNVFLGKNAGTTTSNGSYNTFLGTFSGLSNSSGDLNTFIGHEAGNKNTSGSSNTFIGQQAGYHNLSGSFNSAFGQSAGFSNVGFGNTFLGQNAGSNSNIADFNVFVGERAGFNADAASENVIVGSEAGLFINDGNNNVIVGHGSGKYSIGSGNVFIGNSAGANESLNNKLYISNSSTSSPLIKGDFSSGEIILNGKVTIGDDEYFQDGTNSLTTNASLFPSAHLSQDLGYNTTTNGWDDVFADDYITISDMRLKEDVKDLSYGLSELMALKTYSYILRDDPFKEKKLGLSAQNVLELMPEIVKTNNFISNKGILEEVQLENFGLKYDQMIPVLVKCIQEQQAQINALKEKLEVPED